MTKLICIFTVILIGHFCDGQFVAKMEIKEPIKGLCSNDVYVLFSVKGQQEPVCSISKEEIVNRLNNEVSFLKDSTSYNDKGMVNFFINCKSELVKCEMDNKTRNPVLDQQIVAVFTSLGPWTAGKLNKKNVDCAKLLSFEIKEGKFILE